jgi:hypothetical protein
MRLPKPFYRLAVRFDVARLREEIEVIPADAWAPHPNAIPGNSSLRLISVGGGENDDVNGLMLPTAHLRSSSYLRQVLSSFGVVWSRSRLLRLAPGAEVPEHADINYHWHNRVRLHIPVVTRSEVRFHCGGQSVHMAPGEAWLFDNWRLHRVENPTPDERIHLVADTSGSASFWQFVADSESGSIETREVAFDPSLDRVPLTERTSLAPVMSPAEVELLLLDLRAELVPANDTSEQRARLLRYQAMLESMCCDWRQLYALYGTEREGWGEFVKVRDSVRATSRTLADGLIMRTNRVEAHKVLEARLLQSMLVLPESLADYAATLSTRPTSRERPVPAATAAHIERPVFLIAAPRSGSTLLFETLAVTPQLFTLGGEGHALIEGLQKLRPGAAHVDSNRLTAQHASPDVIQHVVNEVLRDAHGPSGERPREGDIIRFLEKTPKNALRIPFLSRVFPDALYVFLWRDPRESLSSIMEAWRSGRWKTYNGLPGFEGPWSLLLPPGWHAFSRRPLEEIAAFQWEAANRIALDDLMVLPRERWTAVSYESLYRDPLQVVRHLCEFADIEFDDALAQRLAAELPLSRYTLTPPAPGKWRAHQTSIEHVLPSVQDTWDRLRSLH